MRANVNKEENVVNVRGFMPQVPGKNLQVVRKWG